MRILISYRSSDVRSMHPLFCKEVSCLLKSLCRKEFHECRVHLLTKNRAQIAADGSVDPAVLDSLDPEKVFISFVVNYFDHLGQYVNDTVITVPCNSPKFGGNCLNSDQKVFVNWNFKDHNGRFVGTGVYTVQFKMVVRYARKKIEEEIKDKWGVRRKKKK